jgi:hypothetical protein
MSRPNTWLRSVSAEGGLGDRYGVTPDGCCGGGEIWWAFAGILVITVEATGFCTDRGDSKMSRNNPLDRTVT